MTTSGWVTPDVGFSAAQLAAAREVVERDLGGSRCVGLAFLGGSYAVGLGHATSDVDLYVVGDGLPATEAVYERRGIGVHTGTLSTEFVTKLVSLGSEYATSGADRKQIMLDFRTLNELCRLVTGVRVVCSPRWAALLEPLRRDVVRQILTARNANIFAALAEDVVGALVSRDLYTAIHASGLALEAAAEATLAAADDLYVGPKFLYRRLARTAVTAPWTPLIWRLLNQSFPDWPSEAVLARGTLDLAAVERVRDVAERRLLVGNQLLSWCAIEGWDRPLRYLPPPPDELTGCADRPLRSPYFAPVRFTDGWALMGPEDGYEVNEAMVRLWRSLGTCHTSEGSPEGAAALRALASIGALRADELLPRTSAIPQGALPPGLLLKLAPHFHSHPKVAPASLTEARSA